VAALGLASLFAATGCFPLQQAGFAAHAVLSLQGVLSAQSIFEAHAVFVVQAVCAKQAVAVATGILALQAGCAVLPVSVALVQQAAAPALAMGHDLTSPA
jgi:hypothetical protein